LEIVFEPDVRPLHRGRTRFETMMTRHDMAFETPLDAPRSG
jgi:hypothetical protein